MSKNISSPSQNLTPQLAFKGLNNNFDPSKVKTSSTKGNLATTKSSSGLGNVLGGIGGAVTGAAKGIAMGLGAEEATIKSGATDILNGVGDLVGNLGPAGAAAGFVLKGLGVVNDLAGPKLGEQKTKGINTGAYATQINPNAGGKLDVFNSIFTNKKNQINKLTKRTDSANILAANSTYKNSVNQLGATNSYGDIATKTQQQLSGGLRTNILSAKKGSKINPSKFKNIINKVKKAQLGTDDLEKVKSGTKIPEIIEQESTQSQNVLPEGALHARLNHYEGELGEQVTNKGIPVITEEEGGKILQHAEIERNEIIFHKEATLQLEE